MRVLMITRDWPTAREPFRVPYLVRQAEHLRAAGVEVTVFVAGKTGPRPLRWARQLRRLAALARSGGFDLAHAQTGPAGVAALLTGLPLVVTFRGSDVLGTVGRGGRYTLKGRLLQSASRAVARRARAVVVVAPHLAAALRGGPAPVVVPSGVDLAAFAPVPRGEARRRLGLEPDARLVLFGGRPANPVKRWDLARRAVRLLPEGLAAELVPLDGVAHADVPLWMSACDALLLTSRHEGSPNVVKEALACNLPVVAVNVGDVAERLRGVEGCAVAASDRPADLAAALERVLASGARAAGRQAVAELDERLLTARVLDVYRQALASAVPLPVAGRRVRTA
jgi:teichuronic acid biosynthesis glycosyltransferase TuaC